MYFQYYLLKFLITYTFLEIAIASEIVKSLYNSRLEGRCQIYKDIVLHGSNVMVASFSFQSFRQVHVPHNAGGGLYVFENKKCAPF